LKGLYGEYNRLQEFSNAFRNRIHEHVNNLPQEKQKSARRNTSSQSLNSVKFGKTSSKIQTTIGNRGKGSGFNQLSDDDSDNENKVGTYNETSSIYQIHKILSSE